MCVLLGALVHCVKVLPKLNAELGEIRYFFLSEL